MSPELLSGTAGFLLSLAFSYVPGLNSAYDRLTPTGKRLVMVFLLAITAIGAAIWACSDPPVATFGMCLGGTDWRAVLTAFFAALVTNQATHRITPQKEDEKP